MKTARILLTVTIALATVLPMMADDKPAKRSRLSSPAQAMLRMHMLHKALESLELTEEQKGEVKKLHEEMGPEMKGAFEKLKGILTEEQQATAEKAAKEAKEAGKEGRAFFAAVQGSIELTAEQQKQMAELGKELGAFQREVMKKSLAILTAEQKKQLKAKMARPAAKKGKKGKKKAE